MLKLTVKFILSLISFRFTLSLFFPFFVGGGGHLKYLGLQGGAGKKFLM